MAAIKSGKYLKDYLRDRMYKGKLNIPYDKIDCHSMPSTVLSDSAKLVYVKFYERDILKTYMANTFYKTALIPQALKLAEYNSSLIGQEIDLMTHNENTSAFIKTNHDEIVGAFLGCHWLAQNDYDAFPVDPTEWLNIAGKIANENANSDMEAMEIWRDYQYQLIYHVLQKEAKSQGKRIIVYPGMGYWDPEYRGGTSLKLLSSQINSVPEDHYVGFIGTFKYFRDGMYVINSDKKSSKHLTTILYKDLTFQRNGVLIFGHLVDHHGIAFHGSLP